MNCTLSSDLELRLVDTHEETNHAGKKHRVSDSEVAGPLGSYGILGDRGL